MLLHLHWFASMEPSSGEDGDVPLELVAFDARWLQWSRPQVRTETLQVLGVVIELTTLQWSRPQVRTETCSDGVASSRAGASMEPSSGEDGDIAVPPVIISPNALQWSRPQVRTETYGWGLQMFPLDKASMEPSSGEDGDKIFERLVMSPCKLQWSRPQVRTETGIGLT